jgi:hypothetical protein
MVFGVRIDLSLEDEIDHKRVDDGDREYENAGAPEKERDTLGRRDRLLDRDRERHHVGIERYRERSKSRAKDRKAAEEWYQRIFVSDRKMEHRASHKTCNRKCC